MSDSEGKKRSLYSVCKLLVSTEILKVDNCHLSLGLDIINVIATVSVEW